MAPDSTQWRLEPHTAAKHEILRRYMNAWFPILGSYHGRVVFLDGFAGPGIYADGEPGSPRDHYESLADQFELFKRAYGGLPPNVKVRVEQTTFEAAATPFRSAGTLLYYPDARPGESVKRGQA